jgi:hypothetical protein
VDKKIKKKTNLKLYIIDICCRRGCRTLGLWIRSPPPLLLQVMSGTGRDGGDQREKSTRESSRDDMRFVLLQFIISS